MKGLKLKMKRYEKPKLANNGVAFTLHAEHLADVENLEDGVYMLSDGHAIIRRVENRQEVHIIRKD